MVLSLLLGPANRPDQELFEAVLEDISPVATPGGWAAPAARPLPRRQGRRRPPLPRLPHPPRDQGRHRPPRHRVIAAAGPPPLEGGAHDRLAVWLPAAAGAGRPWLGAVLCVRAAGLLSAVVPPLHRPHDPPARPAPAGLLAAGWLATRPGRAWPAARRRAGNQPIGITALAPARSPSMAAALDRPGSPALAAPHRPPTSIPAIPQPHNPPSAQPSDFVNVLL